jgi:hypothetical protein
MESRFVCADQNVQRRHCCSTVGRRHFLATVGLTALGASIGAIESALAIPTGASPKPRVRAFFVRQKTERYFMGWPGAAYDVKARQADYTRVLEEAAKTLDVDLELSQEPVTELGQIDALVSQCDKAPPDGVILISMCLNTSWDKITQFVVKRPPALPVIVYSPKGTSFLNHVQQMAERSKGTKTFLASTSDVDWLEQAMRMLHTHARIKRTRICVVQGQKPSDLVLERLGSTLRYVHFHRFTEEYKKVAATDEVRAMAELYSGTAQKTIEPSAEDMLEAAKMYAVCQRVMEGDGCDGIAVDCLPHVRGRTTPPPCLAFCRLNDEGRIAACQADWPAAISLRLVWLLLNRPGFMQNNCVDTTRNTVMGSHCTCPLRLQGPGKDPVPFILRSHAESDLGVATQVLWPVGEEVTIMKFSDAAWWAAPKDPASAASSILLGTGQIVRNIDNPPSGGCRTSLEVQVDGIDDVRQMKHLHHQLIILGNHKDNLRAYCEMAGIEVQSV